MNYNLASPLFGHSLTQGTRLALSVAGHEDSYAALAALAQRVAG